MFERKRSPLEWNVAKDFTDTSIDSVELCVRVSKTKGQIRPLYSVTIGKLIVVDGATRLVPHLPVFVQGTYPVRIVSVGVAVVDLLIRAEKYIQEQVEEDRLEAETREANRNKPITRQTGKTAKQREKEQRR